MCTATRLARAETLTREERLETSYLQASLGPCRRRESSYTVMTFIKPSEQLFETNLLHRV